MLQLTGKGLAMEGDLGALREQFATRHFVVLEKLLTPELLERVQRQIKVAPWRSSAFDDFGTEFTLDDPLTVHLLMFLMNTPKFLNAIRVVTGCPQIGDCWGRIYRLSAGPQHHLSWHDDTKLSDERREVGFSLNLSTEVFCGGVFELRDHKTKASLGQVGNTGFGDAILFRISTDLQHRVTEVTGTADKTACAGWFRSAAQDFFTGLRTNPRPA
jgi:hypothetical protein